MNTSQVDMAAMSDVLGDNFMLYCSPDSAKNMHHRKEQT